MYHLTASDFENSKILLWFHENLTDEMFHDLKYREINDRGFLLGDHVDATIPGLVAEVRKIGEEYVVNTFYNVADKDLSAIDLGALKISGEKFIQLLSVRYLKQQDRFHIFFNVVHGEQAF